MCGLVCNLSFNSNSPEMELLKKMNNSIHHRGPDDEGYFLDSWVGIGFKRLSIIDTSKNGHQPMSDDSNSVVLVMNGEVYNFQELKANLSKVGVNFKSSSDTEVVLQGYKIYGTSIFEKLEGMFSIIIYDRNLDEIIVARDHLGIKPLYYYIDSTQALFGSEIKSFQHKLNFQVNTNQIYEQFTYGYVSGENTIYKDIYRVLPGTYHRYNQNGLISINEFYSLKDSLLTKNYIQVSDEEIENELNNSILEHTVSDVGYNIQLSGGIDSSYITAFLSEENKQNLDTYSIELKDYKQDESKYQRIVAEKYNTKHHSYSVGPKDLFDSFEKATWHHDIPLVHFPSVFLMLLSKYSRSTSKVILTGEGADELFLGYTRYRDSFKHQLLFQLKNIPLFSDYLPNIPQLKKLRYYLKDFEFGIDEMLQFSVEKNSQLFNEFNKNISFRKENTSHFKSIIHKKMISDQTSYLSWLLERQDKMSMAMSVEARVPFTNYKLFNLLNSIDPKRKSDFVQKKILKRFSEKYFDKSFIYRRKNGFNLPYDEWLRDDNSLKQWFDFLTDKTFKERSYYNVPLITKLVDEHLYQKKDHSKYLLKIISFEIWHRIFIDKQISNY